MAENVNVLAGCLLRKRQIRGTVKEEKDKSIFLREYIYLLPKKCKKFIIFTIKFQLSFLLYKFSIFNYLKLII